MFGFLSRRRWLKWTLGAGGFLFMGGAGLLSLRGKAPHVSGLRILSDHEHRTLVALASAVLPRGGPFPIGARDVDLAGAFDRFLADEPRYNQRDLQHALFLLEMGPVLFEGRRMTFSHLSETERLAHFERWMRSGSLLRRQVAIAFKKFLNLVFYDTPEVWPHIGYDGPMFRA